MSLQINRNFAAMSAGALQSLHSNQTTMGKAITHVSTGKRVNTASDDISAYVGGKRFQSDAEGYKALHTGVQNGAAYLHAVENSFDSFSTTLQNMRTLAIKYQTETDSSMKLQYQTEFDALKNSILATASGKIGTHDDYLSGSGSMAFVIGLDSSTSVDRSAFPTQLSVSTTGVVSADKVTNDSTHFDSSASRFDSNTKSGSILYENKLYQLTGNAVLYGSEQVGTYNYGNDASDGKTALSIQWYSTSASDTKLNVSWSGINGLDKSISDLTISSSTAVNDVSSCITLLGAEQAKVGAGLNALEYISEHLSNMASMEETAYTSLTEADMAAEMTSYVKSNIYAQASQAMIAQANQSLAQVLNLLE